MVVQSNNLNLIPGQISPRVNVSQYDKKSRRLTFSLYNGSQPFNITSGMAVTIEGTKPDNTGFQYAMTATIDSNVVSISIEQQMTVIAGDVPCEIVVSNAGKRLASANFILVVEPAALNENTIISETELPLIEEAAELAENIAIYVTTIHEDALKAEGYAVGKQNGVDVGSGSEYFHNNAKYYKEQAAQVAQETVENLIMGEVVDSEPYVLRQGLGNLADMELVGGSLAWNQLVTNGNFADTSSWNTIRCTFSVANNVGKITASEQWGRINGPQVNVKKEHKYFLTATIKGTTDTYFGIGNTYAKYCDSTSRKTYNLIINALSDALEMPQVGDRRTSDWTEITVENFMFIDLTQLFGSTIADYIYSLETATAGAGVAWFKKYFPNAYYGYQSSKIESVNVANRKVVGKNLLENNVDPDSFVINTLTWTKLPDGSVKVTGTADANRLYQINNNWTKFEKGKTYIINGAPVTGNNGVFIGIYKNATSGNYWKTVAGGQNLSFTVDDDTDYLAFVCRVANGFNCGANGIIFKPMIRLATVEDATYEPYTEYSYPFDPSIQLRGIPKLVDNKLSYDGDIYTADGSVTRNSYQYVIDGSVGEFNSTNNRFIVRPTSVNIPQVNDDYDDINCIADKLVAITNRSGVDSGVGIYASGNIIAICGVKTSLSEYQTWLASNPITVVYKRLTPTTESAEPFQNPQRAFSDGTEEFIDAGVTAGTRDVSIPVGNNTTYQLNETLPPTEDYVDGALKFKAAISALGTDESGRTTASRAYTAGEFFYKDGKMYKVLTSIAQGATFTINTNCQQTTLFAELKALAQ